ALAWQHHCPLDTSPAPAADPLLHGGAFVPGDARQQPTTGNLLFLRSLISKQRGKREGAMDKKVTKIDALVGSGFRGGWRAGHLRPETIAVRAGALTSLCCVVAQDGEDRGQELLAAAACRRPQWPRPLPR
uniref:Uncharacterized protein n=1 Tax=Aegilops tauschii subsp. strangulata TaxID=200361 RepID=A0A452XWR5_AEGTS